MNKYTLPHYTPMIEIGETQQEIDLVNKECKNIYMGVWQGVMKLCIEVKQHQVENNLDTTFIDNEYNLVWDSIHEAFEENLITKEEFQILWECKQDWHDLYAKQMGLPTTDEEVPFNRGRVGRRKEWGSVETTQPTTTTRPRLARRKK